MPNTPKPVTTADQWIADITEGTELEVPSGHVALVRNPGLTAFIQAGIVPNGLMSIAQDAAARGKAPDMADVAAADPDRINDILQLIDNVIVHCVIEPAIHPEPTPSEKRDPKKLYVKMVDPEDKMFIFQWVNGGTHDLEQFRAEYRATVGNLSSGQGRGTSAKRAARPTPARRASKTAAKRPRKA